jgi:hypothetical protein
MDFKGLDPLGRRLGFLAPLLAQGFGFRDGFLQRSDMGFQSAAFVRFRPLARRMGGLLSYLIDKDAGLKCLGEIGIGHCAVSSIQSNEFLIDYDATRLMKDTPAGRTSSPRHRLGIGNSQI